MGEVPRLSAGHAPAALALAVLGRALRASPAPVTVRLVPVSGFGALGGGGGGDRVPGCPGKECVCVCGCVGVCVCVCV